LSEDWRQGTDLDRRIEEDGERGERKREGKEERISKGQEKSRQTRGGKELYK